MKFLIFSDLHAFEKESLNKIKLPEDCKTVMFLGDIKASTLRYIMDYFPKLNYYGILGNHDDLNLFDSVNQINQILEKPKIIDADLKKIETEMTFIGLKGCVKYNNNIGYTQEEAVTLPLDSADILFSHETGYHYINSEKDDITHEGYIAIDKYLENNKPKYNIFGHHHKNCIFQKYKTVCVGVFGCVLFDTLTEKRIIFFEK